MKNRSYSILVLLAALFIAGCQNTSRPGSSVASTSISRTSIQGDWRATEGTLLATFSGSKFQSVNTDTNQVVASGAFQYNSPEDIRLEWVGALSGRNSARCKLLNANLLDCTPSNGSGFQMQRVSA